MTDKVNIEDRLKCFLRKSAPFMHSLSSFTCKGGRLDEEDCSWYHGAWQYLRALNVVSAPTWHKDFYKGTLGDFLRSRNEANILISGTADYSLLATLLWISKSIDNSVSIKVFVLDSCLTPLIICRWFSNFTDTNIKTIHQNILAVSSRYSFDLIISDAFITRFEGSAKGRVIKKWYKLLKPAGSIITTIRKEDCSTKITHSKKEINKFTQKVEKELSNLPTKTFGISDEKTVVTRLARKYVQNMTSHPIESSKQAKELFKEAGFSDLLVDIGTVGGEISKTKYVRLKANKLKS